jgi:type IV pilus assembly protein PilP
MPVIRTIKPMLLLSLTALLGLGCGEDPPQGQRRPGSQKPVAAAPVPSVAVTPSVAESPQEDLADAYIYTPVGKRDPFRSAYKESKGSVKDADSPRTPLQRFEIDQLKLIAVVTGISRPMAMVETPEGKGFSVKVGTRIGKNFGRIVRIKNKEIIVSEDYRDWNGRKVTNYIHMSFAKEKDK